MATEDGKAETAAGEGATLGAAAPASDTNWLNGRKFSERYYALLAERMRLPVQAQREHIVETVRQSRVVVVQSETGSGKSTQIPAILLRELMREENPRSKRAKVVVTEPRRIAATSVAARVAEELDVELGKEVGYCIRFDDKSDQKLTRLKYVTDGMLLRETLSDPLLSEYSIVVVDEAHERSISTDVMLGILKRLIWSSRAGDLKLIVMSATLDISSLQTFFEGHAPLLKIPGRMYPVEINFEAKAVEDYVLACVDRAVSIHLRRSVEDGDILIFLTGEDEIETARRELNSAFAAPAFRDKPAIVLPCYAAMAPRSLQRVFEPAPALTRKIVIATTIAETSITIDGVVFVIDSGYAKQKIYHPGYRIESLLVREISKDQAKQRAGRAGRTKPGVCYRMYTETAFNELMPEAFIPEMRRSNLTAMVLQLRKLGITDLARFEYIDPPAPAMMMRALERLLHLRALESTGELTKDGLLMARLPLDPQFTRIILKSIQLNCSYEIVRIIAILNSGGAHKVFLHHMARPPGVVWRAKRRFEHDFSDHLMLLNVLLEYEAAKRHGDEHAWCHENCINARTLNGALDIFSQLQRVLDQNHLRLQSCGYIPVLDASGKGTERGRGLMAAQTNAQMLICRALAAGSFMQCAVRDSVERRKPKNGGGRGGSTPQLARYVTVCEDEHQLKIHRSTGTKADHPMMRCIIYEELAMSPELHLRTVSGVLTDWLIEEDVSNLVFRNQSFRTKAVRKAFRRSAAVTETTTTFSDEEMQQEGDASSVSSGDVDVGARAETVAL
ncbi:putative pre-mRNA-splicing factor ATP-dependent RNA helicase DEAH2 [Porphyridium purpureum]|uniref:RNA helicase n=1 Tax=Porphyridium purpureum TaxID=35688 RepID=A0A5J4YMY2_PORPP|nr:putative pre-mRNA-splicing factor ATP-dependent RNA helicase DEAH2 [Porphyridium purpureum]|eukprot:POR6156..scf295_9